MVLVSLEEFEGKGGDTHRARVNSLVALVEVHAKGLPSPLRLPNWLGGVCVLGEPQEQCMEKGNGRLFHWDKQISLH